jgi:hypothetical protein
MAGITDADIKTALQEHQAEEAERRKKSCYTECRLCGMCKNHSVMFAECTSCYPPDAKMTEVLGRHYHCRCKSLPRMGENQWGQYGEIHHRD